MELIEVGTVPYAGWATYSGDAGTVGGRSADDLEPLSQATVEAYARAVCYDVEAEMTGLLDDNYAPVSHTHAAGDITSGTLDVARFDAYADLGASNRLDNNQGPTCSRERS